MTFFTGGWRSGLVRRGIGPVFFSRSKNEAVRSCALERALALGLPMLTEKRLAITRNVLGRERSFRSELYEALYRRAAEEQLPVVLTSNLDWVISGQGKRVYLEPIITHLRRLNPFLLQALSAYIEKVPAKAVLGLHTKR
jgi:hypothetical protein